MAAFSKPYHRSNKAMGFRFAATHPTALRSGRFATSSLIQLNSFRFIHLHPAQRNLVNHLIAVEI